MQVPDDHVCVPRATPMRTLLPRSGEALCLRYGANCDGGSVQVGAEATRVLLLLVLIDAVDAQPVREALATEQHTQAVALAGAARAVPAHVVVLVSRVRRGECHRRGGRHTERHSPVELQRAGGKRVGPGDSAGLDGEPAPVRRWTSNRSDRQPPVTLLPAEQTNV